MKPDPAKNQAWGAFGAHSGVFPKIPARDISLEPIYFRGKCAPNAPQPPAGPGTDSEKMGHSGIENCGEPGLRAPPARGPRQKGPGATMCRRLPSGQATGSTHAGPLVSRRRIGCPLVAVPVHPAPAPPRDRLARFPSSPPRGPAAPPIPRHRASRPAILCRSTRPGRSAPTDSGTSGQPMSPARFTTRSRFPAMITEGESPMHDPTRVSSFDLGTFDPVARPRRQAAEQPPNRSPWQPRPRPPCLRLIPPKWRPCKPS
jgi:hypothetical protein